MLKKITNLLKKFLSNEKYARHVGVKIGKNCLIGTRDWGSEPYLITIGNNVQITKNVHFHTHGGAHVLRIDNPNYDTFGMIKIEDWVYIGSESHILPGITIGNGSLVAAASVVTKSIPPGVVVGGNPARLICSIEEYKRKNSKYNINTNKLPANEKEKKLRELNEEAFIKKSILK